jgi:hypothetical protein
MDSYCFENPVDGFDLYIGATQVDSTACAGNVTGVQQNLTAESPNQHNDLLKNLKAVGNVEDSGLKTYDFAGFKDISTLIDTELVGSHQSHGRQHRADFINLAITQTQPEMNVEKEKVLDVSINQTPVDPSMVSQQKSLYGPSEVEDITKHSFLSSNQVSFSANLAELLDTSSASVSELVSRQTDGIHAVESSVEWLEARQHKGPILLPRGRDSCAAGQRSSDSSSSISSGSGNHPTAAGECACLIHIITTSH